LAALNELFGEYDRALAICDSIDTLEPGTAITLRAFVLADVGRIREAERLFTLELQKPDPQFPPARANSYLAMLAYMRRDYPSGVRYAESAVQRSPDIYNFWIAGLLTASMRDSQRTREYYEMLKSQSPGPDQPEANHALRFAHHLLGTLELARGNGAAAVHEFETCLKYTGRSDGTYFKTDLGRALLMANEPQRAAAVLSDALAFNANYPPALLYFGQASFRLGKVTEGRRALERLAKLLEKADEDFPLKRELRRLRDASEAHRPLAARASMSCEPHCALGTRTT
jgi:tetratricopeptide (TPR) repeat protein